MDTAWTWRRFDALAVHDLYDALALRSRVFVMEQNCPYQDPDGVDPHCWHLLGRATGGHGNSSGSTPAGNGVLQAYLRVVDPGVKYAEPSIGRVITAPEVRRSGLGRALMAEGIARCQATWPARGVRISAQERLRRFYQGMGFLAVGEPYQEDGIPHLEMLLPAQELPP